MPKESLDERAKRVYVDVFAHKMVLNALIDVKKIPHAGFSAINLGRFR